MKWYSACRCFGRFAKLGSLLTVMVGLSLGCAQNPPVSDSPVPPADSPREPVLETAKDPAAESDPTADPIVEEEIKPIEPSRAERLAASREQALENFNRALSEDKLSVPSQDNALFWAQKFLRYEGSEDIFKGLTAKVWRRYLELAAQAIQSGNLSLAKSYLGKAQQLGATSRQFSPVNKAYLAAIEARKAAKEKAQQQLAEAKAAKEKDEAWLAILNRNADQDSQLKALESEEPDWLEIDAAIVVSFSEEEIQRKNGSVDRKFNSVLPMVLAHDAQVVLYTKDKSSFEWLHNQFKQALGNNPSDYGKVVYWKSSRHAPRMAIYPPNVKFFESE